MLPTKGLIMPFRIIKRENTPDVIERLQVNSLRRATKKMENEYNTVELRARVERLTPTMIHLK
jgi:hypothetical protein